MPRVEDARFLRFLGRQVDDMPVSYSEPLGAEIAGIPICARVRYARGPINCALPEAGLRAQTIAAVLVRLRYLAALQWRWNKPTWRIWNTSPPWLGLHRSIQNCVRAMRSAVSVEQASEDARQCFRFGTSNGNAANGGRDTG